jgi:phosphomannomutase
VMLRPSGTEPEIKLYAEAACPVASRSGLAAAAAAASGLVDRLLAEAADLMEPPSRGERA